MRDQVGFGERMFRMIRLGGFQQELRTERGRVLDREPGMTLTAAVSPIKLFDGLAEEAR